MKKATALALLLIPLLIPGCVREPGPASVSPPIVEKDGWEVFTSGQQINDLLFERDFVWVATDGGVIRWQPKRDDYWKYTTLDGLASNSVSCMLRDSSGMFWFGTAAGLSSFDGTKWQKWLPGKRITAVAEDKKGRVWAVWQSETHQYDVVHTSSLMATSDESLSHSLGQGVVHALLSDRHRTLWVGTSNGVVSYDGDDWRTWTMDDSLPDTLEPCAQDLKGNIWFNGGKGATRFDGKNWKTYTAADGLASDTVEDIGVDSEGKVWFSHGWNGVTSFGGTWRHYPTQKDSH